MSNYGPPGGPYPGRGRDPHEEPYTEPSDPWGDWNRDNNEGGGYDQQGYDQGGNYNPGYANPGYDVTGTGYAQRPAEGAPGGWNPAPAPQVPQPAPPKRSGGMIALVAILVVLVLAGGAGAAYVLLNQDGDNQAGGDPTPAPSASATGAPSATPEATPSASAAANEARNARKGDCVQNVGDESKPQMQIAACGQKGAYEVLARFDEPAEGQDDAQKKCADVEGYTNWYFFNSQLDSLDFVLCLKQR